MLNCWLCLLLVALRCICVIESTRIRMVMDVLVQVRVSFLERYLGYRDRFDPGENIGRAMVVRGITGHSARLATYPRMVRRNTRWKVLYGTVSPTTM
ncbi:hypothetical protein M6B38_102435 [Iris pallida]|uniref:Secreted protein n=1 Tax=Iris pallida TaxID=29817 RepID=A0AAX6INN8_IRIPA|nr:hypothetical protein M6B38_102435 [Iris pallida]